MLRNNFSKNQFDNLSGDANLGLVFARDRDVHSLTAQFNQYELASARFRTAAGFTGQWQRNLDARTQVSGFAQYSSLSYQTQPIRDADRWVGGAAYAHALRTGEVVFASLYLVNERARAAGVPWLGHDGVGARLGGQMNYDAKTVLFANASVEQRRYGADDPSFLTTRRDTQWDLALGATYSPARDWKVIPKLSFTQNDSNAELNEYHRESVSVTVRRDF